MVLEQTRLQFSHLLSIQLIFNIISRLIGLLVNLFAILAG